MSDTPEGERDPLPVSAGHACAGRWRQGPGRSPDPGTRPARVARGSHRADVRPAPHRDQGTAPARERLRRPGGEGLHGGHHQPGAAGGPARSGQGAGQPAGTPDRGRDHRAGRGTGRRRRHRAVSGVGRRRGPGPRGPEDRR